MRKKIDKTKIIATIGPASEKSLVLKKLIHAGADIFRFNLKHNSVSWHAKIIDRARKIAKEQNKKIEILVDIPSYSFQDGIDMAASKKAEHVALSYLNEVNEVIKFKKIIDKVGFSTNIIAKIETKKALSNFTAILDKTDSVMVARGDLGRSIAMEKLPLVQKEIVFSCKEVDKMVIVATEMLLSMVTNKMATRAEVSDVANAVLDESDAVMLSEETSIGKHPVEAVKLMSKIIHEAETWHKLGHLHIHSTKKEKFKFGL